MLRMNKMIGVLLLTLAAGAAPWTVTRAEQSVQVAGQNDQGTITREQVSEAGHPAMFVGVRDYDAGEVWEGDEIVHTFTVENRGTAQLDITKVNPG